ncbi:SDR family NAD(P)-dependent oxidoreductase [Halostagnicola sp. A-GB9-2]|uniref:SDR family NAD(P)-dependent oxidoreductase n=1 Tax=Halostagnicola sp. A-GB9-2 TaxID=3048066 RepID=UPI0024C01EA4|nr:SDR family NAD(P)-dependent oxidoreductase [Halostagnicola sp. A-GB9-2]MDJ1431988.1 SDR family NAD(P)-dependent oxidoreductase [Halostagnicola sp. A-GB9-2]
MITGQNVLLTGGAGSVGRTLIPRFLNQDPNVLRLLDNNESGLAEIRSAIDDDRCRYLAGDVRDKDRLSRAMENIDIVVHTAAMKHVDVCEYNPFEAVKTNTLGLQNVVDAAIDANVQRVVFTSSDKAVNPANTMGTTKLLGERLITAGNNHRGDRDLRFASVRFGNIINSSQSVIPIFTEQIREGGPVTLTDERMTRFFLTYNDVFGLVSQAIEKMQGGEVFVYKMPAIKIEDLAEAMIEILAPEFGYDPTEIDIDVIGRRPGETFHEEIMTSRETRRAYENESMYAIQPEMDAFQTERHTIGFTDSSEITLSSENAPKLSTDEIIELLDENGALAAAGAPISTTDGALEPSSEEQSATFDEETYIDQ